MSIELLCDKKYCCGCGACSQVCPKKAITMREDEYGFCYPFINEKKCIECGACLKVCQYHNPVMRYAVSSTYAAAINDERILKSSSGGAFAEIARIFIRSGGTVVGAAMTKEEGWLEPVHRFVESENEIPQIQGSKYVQSNLNNTYTEVKTRLQKGERVLFSGTPCQIAGLRAYLKRDYDSLYTVDVICHGVPNARMFNEYIRLYSKKMKGEIVDYRFRDKQLGWGINMRAYIDMKSGRQIEKIVPPEMSSYFSLFLRSDITRESCINCCYASSKRVADMTLGDYWGINTAHPDAIKNKILDDKQGVSCVFINTDKGKKLFEEMRGNIAAVHSDYQTAIRFNGQAERPVKEPKTRKRALESYRNGGYEALERYYWSTVGNKKYYYLIKNIIPRRIRVFIKKKMGK